MREFQILRSKASEQKSLQIGKLNLESLGIAVNFFSFQGRRSLDEGSHHLRSLERSGESGGELAEFGDGAAGDGAMWSPPLKLRVAFFKLKVRGFNFFPWRPHGLRRDTHRIAAGSLLAGERWRIKAKVKGVDGRYAEAFDLGGTESAEKV